MRLLMFISLALFCSCRLFRPVKHHHDEVYEHVKYPQTKNIPMKVKPNTLGFARVRAKSSFSVADTSNVIARVPCGTEILVDIPEEFLKGGKRSTVWAWYFKTQVKDSLGKMVWGYMAASVLEDETEKYIEKPRPHKRKYGDTSLVYCGIYHGRNMWLQNPYTANAYEGSCITGVTVNGNNIWYPDEFFDYPDMIDFKKGGYKVGDSVRIVITHFKDCKPKVWNPDPVKPENGQH